MRMLPAAVLALSPMPAFAQAYSCAVPAALPPLRPDLPDDRAPQRLLPIGGYTLAISWSPQFCRERGDTLATRLQCGGGNRFGFVLHGLWPDGVGKQWPQYCRSTPLLPDAVIRAGVCATPSPQLMQHEWAKHGTCMPGVQPADYFRRSNALFGKLRYPDMQALSRRRLSAGALAAAMARANPGLRADMMRITTERGGWLDEIWLCMDKNFRYARCPARRGGVAPRTAVKVWRGGR